MRRAPPTKDQPPAPAGVPRIVEPASAPDVAGTWDPWFFWVAGIWCIALAIHALRTYLGPPVGPLGSYIRRPIPKAELDREAARLRSSRR